MENNFKVSLYIQNLQERLKHSPLLSFFEYASTYLRLTSTHYDQVFRLLSEGKTLLVGNLELTNTTLYQALLEAENRDSQSLKVSLYTGDDYKVQNQKFSVLIKENNTYLTFGLLDYFIDNHMKIISAPLVLLPIKIEYLKDQDHYQISALNHEVYLNDCLVDYLNKHFHIDISYPIDNNFSLIEYLTYVASKVRNAHFSVNNGCFFASLNLMDFYFYEDLLIHQDEISSLDIIKTIAYFNSEFYHFNKAKGIHLDNNYLSLLDLDNEEYKILKRVSLRENIFIRTNSEANKNHILQNIIYHYLLNNKNILITYKTDEQYRNIIECLQKGELSNFYLDLSINNSKLRLLNQLSPSEKIDISEDLLDQGKINDIVDGYYQIKNSYKRLINSMRMNNEPLSLSINRLIFNYYNLREYPLLDIEIPNIDNLNEEGVQKYLGYVISLSRSVENLKCPYLDHPFYGFNRLDLKQEDYQTLREKIITFDNEFAPARRSFNSLHNIYHLPVPSNMKEMKCILNILSVIPKIKQMPVDLLKPIDFSKIISALDEENKEIENLEMIKMKLISLYENKVFNIDFKMLKEDLDNRPLKRKVIKKYLPYFSSSAKIDEEVLVNVSITLEEYYNLQSKIENFKNINSTFNSYLENGKYDTKKLKEDFDIINKYLTNIAYLKIHEKDYDVSYLKYFNDNNLQELPLHKKRAQIAFNHFFDSLTFLSEYFDKKKIDIINLNLDILEAKVKKMGKEFASINDYLEFYLTSLKGDKVLPNLSHELLTKGRYESFKNMFMHTFYYQLCMKLIKREPLFNSLSKDAFNYNITSYLNYDEKRVNVIKSIVKVNVKAKLKQNSLAIRNSELPYLNTLKEENIQILSLKELLAKVPLTINSLCPIILVKSDDIPLFFASSTYRFDAAISFINDNMSTLEGALISYRAQQIIAFDNALLKDGDQLTLNLNDNERFIGALSQCYVKTDYVSNSYQELVLRANRYDTTFKQYLIDKLRKENWITISNYQTRYGVIDLIVKIPNSSHPTAIVIDHMKYDSLEACIASLNHNELIVNDKLHYAYYHIMPIFFFLNEENEYNKLRSFIIKNTVEEKKIRTKKTTKPLVDVLFSSYIKPFDAYNLVKDKSLKSKEDIFKEFLSLTAPISEKECLAVFNEDYLSVKASLQSENIIKVEHDFVFLNNSEIKFRRVDRNANFSRNLDLVSNEEIAAGIIKISLIKPLSQDDMIKLILLTLGLKKMNHQQYFRLQNIIGGLIEANKITIKEGKIYSNLS